MAVVAKDRRDLPWFFAWMLIGSGYSLGVLGALSIGPFVLIVVVPLTVLLARRVRTHVGLPGLVSGLSLPLFWVAYLNRSGPGMICTSTATSQTCGQEWSPWPWIVVGVILLLVGVAWFASATRRAGAAPSRPDVPIRPDAY